MSTHAAALIAAALAVTLAGDYFLTFTGSHYAAGVSLFCIVQTLYMLVLIPDAREIAVRLLIWAALIILTAVTGLAPVSIINVLALFDITMLGYNAAKACRALPGNDAPPLGCFAAGLTAFFGCDVCVGLNASGIGGGILWYFIWLFYIPSQIFIIITLYKLIRGGSNGGT